MVSARGTSFGRFAAGMLAAAVPCLAQAQASSNIVIDFTNGTPLALYNSVRSIAFGLVVFATLFGFFVEFLRPPGEGGNFLRVGIRAFVFVVILILYPTLAGTVVKSMRGLAEKVSPSQNALLAYFEKRVLLENQAKRNPSGLRGSVAGAASAGGGGATQYGDAPNTTDPTLPKGAPAKPGTPCEAGYTWQLVSEANAAKWVCEPEFVEADGMAGKIAAALRRVLFESVLEFAFAFMGAARYIIEQVGAVLTAVFYLLGPLALTAAIPRGSGTAGNWFKHFVVYASWPVFTGLIMNFVVYVSATTTATDTGYVGALWTAIAVAVSMMSVPTLANQIIGNGGGSFMDKASGMASGTAMSQGKAAIGAMTGGASTAAAAAATAAAGAASGGGGGGGSPLPSNPPGSAAA